jgi:diguanylate cyclase (GGDEF)-like protein
LALTREAHTGRRALVLVLLASAWWAFFEGLLYLSPSLETKLLVTRVEYLGILAVPPLMFVYIVEYLGYLRARRKRTALVLAVVPVVTYILVWTNPAHGLIWLETTLVEMGGITAVRFEHGPFFWAYTIYNYLLLGAGGVLLLRALIRTRSIFRRQFAVILLALLLPLIGNVTYLFGIATDKPFDFTPVAFSAASLLIAAGFFYFKLQDIMPIAKDRIFTSIPDGIIVIDAHDRIIFMNKGVSLPVDEPARYFGKPVSSLYAIFPRLDRVLRAREKEKGITVGDVRGKREFDVRVSPLHDRHGEMAGRLLLFRDITERMRLEGELRRIATTDELTGLLNRREFLDQAEREFNRSGRYNRPLSLLLIDIDYFKDINDTFGHAAGDEALRRLARAGESCVRATDVFGRLGGDEFAMLLLETTAPDAVELAERVRTTMDALELKTDRGPVKFTVSIGVATRDGQSSLDELMSHADRSLYRAKGAGRDRVDAG